MPDPIRWGVAGLGFGASVHVPALRGLPGVEVVAIAGAARDRTAAVAAQLGVPRACAGIDELLALEPDAVTLALPPDVAERAARKVLESGIAVYCEKPLGVSADSARALVAAAAGRPTAVGFEFRELASFAVLRRLVGDGTLGDPLQVGIRWFHRSWRLRERAWSWQLDEARGGGLLPLYLSHTFDLVEWVFGPVEAVEAELDAASTAGLAPPGAVPAADTGTILLHLASGLPVRIDASLAAAVPRAHRWEVALEGGEVVVANEIDDWVSGFTLVARAADGTVVTRAAEPPFPGDGRIPAVRSLAARFAAAVRSGGAVRPDLADGARAQVLIDAARAAARSGSPVPVARLPAPR